MVQMPIKGVISEEKFFKANEDNFTNYNIYRAESITAPLDFKFMRGTGLRNARVLYTGGIRSNFEGHWNSHTYLMLIPKGISMRVLSNAMPGQKQDVTWDVDTQSTWEWEHRSSAIRP